MVHKQAPREPHPFGVVMMGDPDSAQNSEKSACAL